MLINKAARYKAKKGMTCKLLWQGIFNNALFILPVKFTQNR